MIDDELLTRKFLVERSNGFTMSYPFTTYSCIWKLPSDPLLAKLYTYFQRLFLEGINGNIIEGKKSVSGGRKLILEIENRKSELCDLASEADFERSERYQHRIVEEYMLRHDPHTIATEIPVYDDEWVGHIDQIRIIKDRLQVCDFKPNAHKETKAASQVFRYRALLSARTGIPVEKIDACYFDDKSCYFLTP